MNSLESQLNNCKDAACRSATDAEVDAAYFRFVVDDVLTVGFIIYLSIHVKLNIFPFHKDVSGYEPATDLDVDVNRCSENRSSSLLLLRERSPLWCFFAPVSDLWQNEPEFETNRYATVHNMRVTMTAFRDCNSRQECIDGVINVGENVYFSFYQHLLLVSTSLLRNNLFIFLILSLSSASHPRLKVMSWPPVPTVLFANVSAVIVRRSKILLHHQFSANKQQVSASEHAFQI